MQKVKLSSYFLVLAFAVFALALGVDQAGAKKALNDNTNLTDKALKHHGKVTTTEQKTAAATFQMQYQPALMAGAAAPAAPDPGGIPHYFGPYPNWANSPMPTGAVGSVTLIDPGAGYTAPIVTITDLYDSAGADGATAAAVIDPVSGAITDIVLLSGGAGYTAPIVTITDDTGAGASAAAALDLTSLTGGIRKFMDALPGLTSSQANLLGQYIPVAVADTTSYSAGGAGYTSAPTVAITDATGTGATAIATLNGDKVISVEVTNAGSNYSQNPLVVFSGGGAASQAVAIATVDPTTKTVTDVTLTGADYYEIGVVDFNEKMHTDLPPTRIRGYVQIATPVVPGSHIALTDPNGNPVTLPDGSQAYAVDNPHYMGPVIVSRRNVPVRVKFYNLLPTGAGGNLFLPVDKTAMGAGTGPLGGTETYTENRTVSHLHGNNGVWISDGTPNQWITPAGESTSYPKGVSVRNVPDMPDPGDGAVTLYYTNAQSARLEFYHDHALAITRLNVYAGEAAPYLITDDVEEDLINGTNYTGVNPGGLNVLPDIGIPLVIQDKGFVDASTISYQDPTWNSGTTAPAPNTGDLWYPHVYMPAQNPWDPSGINAFGRWHYAPWFWPPATDLMYLPVDNEYYDPINAPWEPPQRPATPNPSMVGEAFMDTAVVNGTAYPYMEVEPESLPFPHPEHCQRPVFQPAVLCGRSRRDHRRRTDPYRSQNDSLRGDDRSPG